MGGKVSLPLAKLKPVDRQRLSGIGFGTALAGLGIALLSLIPAISQGQVLPWPLIAGSAVYLIGGLCLAFNARGEAGKKALIRLRFVRLSFVVIFVILLQRIATH